MDEDMGTCCSNLTPEELAKLKEERIRSARIEQKQRASVMKSQEYIKLLLLGAGESGKSTLFKQMIALYGKGYSEEECKKYKCIIAQNIITAMKTLLSRTKWDRPEEFEDDDDEVKKFGTLDPALTEGAREIWKITVETELSKENGDHVIALWEDAGIKETYNQRAQFQFPDSAEYFFNRVKETVADGYIPNQQDILRARVRTTGIVEQTFEIENKTFVMYDVGGQRNERKKWIHCFENVTSIIFVAAISEYDQVLFEDESTNRMVEALDLFEEIANSPWFKDTSIILFLNKRDLFEKKIEKVPLSVCFPEYKGPQTYKDGCRFITNLFERKNKNAEKEIYSHITCATDTTNIKHVFGSVRDTIIRHNLRMAGLM